MRYIAIGLLLAIAGVIFISNLSGVPATSPLEPTPEIRTTLPSAMTFLPQLKMQASPFPLTIGTTTLLIRLSDEQGEPIEDARVSVLGQMNHGGMIPMTGQSNQAKDGVYHVLMSWPMTGEWRIEVTATRSNGDILQESFDTFIYSIPPSDFRDNGQIGFRSVRENEQAINARADREKWIIIAQGTQAMLRQGHDLTPDEIRLQLSGQNTLVIRNDDFYDHTIGPFFIRAGETIRQTFTQAMEYQGVCSISNSGIISIIVES